MLQEEIDIQIKRIAKIYLEDPNYMPLVINIDMGKNNNGR